MGSRPGSKRISHGPWHHSRESTYPVSASPKYGITRERKRARPEKKTRIAHKASSTHYAHTQIGNESKENTTSEFDYYVLLDAIDSDVGCACMCVLTAVENGIVYESTNAVSRNQQSPYGI